MSIRFYMWRQSRKLGFTNWEIRELRHNKWTGSITLDTGEKHNLVSVYQYPEDVAYALVRYARAAKTNRNPRVYRGGKQR